MCVCLRPLQAQGNEVAALDQEFRKVGRELDNLLAIQGNAQQFASQSQRDAHLNSEIKTVQSELSRREKDESGLNAQIQQCKAEIEKSETTIASAKDAGTHRKEEGKAKQVRNPPSSPRRLHTSPPCLLASAPRRVPQEFSQHLIP